MAHDVDRALHQHVDIFGGGGAGVPGLHHDCGFAHVLRLPRNGHGAVGRGRAIALDDDVVEPEGEHHAARDGVHLLLSGVGPVRVAAQVLVQIAAVKIHHVVALLEHLPGHGPGDPLGLRALRLPGIEAVHALAIHRIQMRNHLRERCLVEQRQDHQGSRKAGRVHRLRQFLHGQDRRILRAVRAGNQREHRPRPRCR